MTEISVRENRFAGLVLLLAFLLRLWKASGTFLNLDEAMHFLAANKSSLAEAHQTSLTLAHPPLLILFLHVWRKLGTSELFLRLPSVIAGTIFCWIFFRWQYCFLLSTFIHSKRRILPFLFYPHG